ncbi:unnamed protein product, partial [Rotaria magnacalcarata]
VGTRTQDECILKFLQLPIEDPYLEGNGSATGSLAYPTIPFSQSGNPVMSTVAFLASVVDPRVASAAAKAALEEFSKMHDDAPPTVTTEGNKEIDEDSTSKPTELNSNNNEESSQIKQEKIDIIDEKNTNEDQSRPIEHNENEEMQTNNDESLVSSSTVPKPTTQQDQQDPRKLLAAEINDRDIQAAAASALAAASVKAKYLASIEERKIKTLVAQVVEMQIKKLEIKLKHFEELESIMDREREMIELQRQQLLQERQQYQFEQIKTSEVKHRPLLNDKPSSSSPPPQVSSSHIVNGNDTHLQSEESMDSQQSDASPAQILLRNEGSTLETSTASSLPNEKMLIENTGENDDSNNISTFTENDTINNNNY